MTQCWLPAEFELGTCGTKHTPKGRGQLAAVPGSPQCSASQTELLYPKPTHLQRVLEGDYSGRGGKKEEFDA